MKELIMMGAEGLTPRLLSAQGFSLEDYKGSTSYLKALGIKLVPEEAEVAAARNPSNPVGRPAKDDRDVDNDNTGISKSAGNNVSDIKMSAVCLKCGCSLEEGEVGLCSDCLESEYSLRIGG